jgi:hypothetical protein
MTTRGKYALGFALAILLFCTVNELNNLRRTPCCDFYFDWGLPFAWLRLGGFEHGRYILWHGLVADALITLLAGLGFGFLLARFGKRL